ncbi:hypothetical protein SAMN04488082_11252 [Desulfomicrobium apsheronum]|uniref:Uncharacterized protein n=2 Tax=Desulfomicrobium apsheronum TaxID=52560 RepID=A0A1I3W8W1_9BACT|nr:hypothetical protein SAMN04488082_11252 [Desulfomicrobium apsheronum]
MASGWLRLLIAVVTENTGKSGWIYIICFTGESLMRAKSIRERQGAVNFLIGFDWGTNVAVAWIFRRYGSIDLDKDEVIDEKLANLILAFMLGDFNNNQFVVMYVAELLLLSDASPGE